MCGAAASHSVRSTCRPDCFLQYPTHIASRIESEQPLGSTCTFRQFYDTIGAMTIHILSEDLAAKIAAGEVIERPASVVKELVENSIDAGAREIRIEIRGGGQRLIRVADDGSGIPANEVETAFARHATSKLSSVDDLFNIKTLGFRGEAMPSIAAVSRLTVITRASVDESGTLMRVDSSKIIEHRGQGAPQGTIVTVEDLFRHVPARLKFLKNPPTESGHITDLVNAYALAYPGLRFSLENDERLVFQSPGTGKLFDVLVKVFGIQVASQMLQVDNTNSIDPANDQSPASIQVSGFISPPSVNRSTRKYMLFFVNHRWVQDRALQHAVIEAYHTALMVGRSPLVALDIVLPPDAVDVNVHPTKSQVRFRDTSAIFTAVQRAVRAPLTTNAPIPSVNLGAPFGQHDSPSSAETQLAIDMHRPIPSPSQLYGHANGYSAPSSTQATSSTKLPMLRVIGQIASTYIIAEGPDGLYLIDQHSAHERVLYEQLGAERADSTIASQILIDPLTLQLTPAQHAVLEAKSEDLATVGFKFEAFGAQTVLLRAIPAVMKKGDPRAALISIIDEIEQGEEPLEKTAEARLISSVCKSIAVKGGQVLSLEEMRELVRRLEMTANPRTCPHGRPTMIQLNVAQLEREFGRK
jgi:DNA mismatch repair protein MutL